MLTVIIGLGVVILATLLFGPIGLITIIGVAIMCKLMGAIPGAADPTPPQEPPVLDSSNPYAQEWYEGAQRAAKSRKK
jgi:hypothetical protein